jgi:hypothetical protein
MKVEIVSADHLNRPDVGSGIASTRFDLDKVDMIVDVPNSGVGLPRIVVANRFFPSTQMCSCCDAQTGPKGREELDVAQWVCSQCGAAHDRMATPRATSGS